MAEAETILVGDIVTMSASAPTAEAVAVSNGHILAVGATDDVMARRGSGTEIVDLGSDALLPGLIEPHTHPDLCAQMYSWIDVSGFTHPTVDGVEAELTAAVAAADPGEWLFAFGLDFMLTTGLGAWTRDRLDRIAPANPLVVMIQSMHTLFVNSQALARAGIGESTPDPGGGGQYVRDASGRLTGRIEEQSAMGPFIVHGLPDPDQVTDLLLAQERRYAEVGITTIGVAGTFLGARQLDVLAEIARRDGAAHRVVTYLRHDDVGGTTWTPGAVDDRGRFRVAGVKLWYDGSPYTGTMLLDEPYLETDLCCCTLGIGAGTVGRANFEPGQLVDLLSELAAGGWQVLTHAQGDRACREIVDLYEAVLTTSRPADHRWRLEHCALISGDELRRTAGLGVSPSFHVDHVRYYGPELRDEIIGAERAEGLMPCRSALDHGHRVSLHADSPMYPPGPLRLAGTAASRRTRHGDTIATHEAISNIEALRAVTIDAAWQLRMDDEVGSVEVGKRADFTVIDRNPLEVGSADLEHVDVTQTWLDGRPIA
ncbi:MAG TPA: amidohydrolase [Acidimicrobiales bacterium]|nr:amidohydrolase [Acidimicrobiales bacterium]